MTTPEKLFNPLSLIFMDMGDKARAIQQKAYMKNRFDFFGIQQGPRRKAFSEFMKRTKLPEYSELPPHIEWLYQQPEREFHYCAIELLMKYKKQWGVEILQRIEYLTINNSWWDTVDYLATKIAGVYILREQNGQKDIIKPWVHSDNMWLNRVAIIHQLMYKEKTNSDLLAYSILPHTSSKEFFHQKAIGWALRQYSRTNANWVVDFVHKHEKELKALSKKEALRLI